jgi:hypothetical protein
MRRSSNMQTTEGFGYGSVERVKPKIVNGVVKEENLSPELIEKLTLVPQHDIGDNSYTLVLEDSGKHVFATDCTITVPYYDDVDFETGTRITIVTKGDSVVVEREGASTALWGPDGSNFGSYIVAARSVVHLLKTNDEEWYLYGDNITVND